MPDRVLTYVEALREATDQAMEADPSIILFGLDVDDHKAIQGSTRGLVEKYGPDRVFTTPLSEDSTIGAAVGAAMAGLRPIHVNIRMDFLMLGMNQIINVAAKAHSMYGGQVKVPLTIRCMVGRSWGQGAQHSQALHSLFMHIPGLKVVAPSNAYDAKGCLLAAIRDDNPVIVMEHRLLYGTTSEVPEAPYSIPPRCRVHAKGDDITIVAISSMVPEALKAAELLAKYDISAQVVDPVWLSPLDISSILNLACYTRHLLIVDNGWLACGASAEIMAGVAERLPDRRHVMMRRIGFAPTPCPTTPSLEAEFYPNAAKIFAEAWRMLRHTPVPDVESTKLDHDAAFSGPF